MPPLVAAAAHLLRPQDAPGPGTHRRTQERPRHHRTAQISRPVRPPSPLPRRADSRADEGTRNSRFLNIKLDNIRVQDEDRYPHMVRHPSTRHAQSARERATPRSRKICAPSPSDGRPELLHPRQHGPVRAAAPRRRRHPTARRRNQARSVPDPSSSLSPSPPRGIRSTFRFRLTDRPRFLPPANRGRKAAMRRAPGRCDVDLPQLRYTPFQLPPSGSKERERERSEPRRDGTNARSTDPFRDIYGHRLHQDSGGSTNWAVGILYEIRDRGTKGGWISGRGGARNASHST